MCQHSNENKYRIVIDTILWICSITAILIGITYETIKVSPSYFPVYVLSTLSSICFCFAILMVLCHIIDIVAMIYITGLVMVQFLLHPYYLLNQY